MGKTDDDKFWSMVERFEEDLTADCDIERFIDRMRKLGFDEDVISERLADFGVSKHD